MKVTASPLQIKKRFPLTISRGTSSQTDNLLVAVEHEGITGYGEMAPFNIGYGEETAEKAKAQIEAWAPQLEDIAPWEFQRVEHICGALIHQGSNMSNPPDPDSIENRKSKTENPGGPAHCALDFALHDYLGKRAGIPVWKLYGCDLNRIPQTSITVGINPPEIVRERIPEMMSRLNPAILKIKLGSPAGIETDKEMFETVRQALKNAAANTEHRRPSTEDRTPNTQQPTPNTVLRVDANGGWSMEGARKMIPWLAEKGCEYVEQPLPIGQESELTVLSGQSPIPIFADESCRTSADIPNLAGKVHGINLKLMKAGGIREGLRVIHTARAHGLQVMMGCMSESSLAIAGSLAIASYADYLDLDSHLNLLPDPFEGLSWIDGRALPSNEPGLGVTRANLLC